MKVLIVCSGNFPEPEKNFSIYQAFIDDQMKALHEYPCTFDLFLIKGKGFSGYLKNYRQLKEYAKQKNVDIIHAHSGMSALLASLVNRPLIVTFHGSDINKLSSNVLSILPRAKAAWSIFVSKKLIQKALFVKKKSSSVLPCGVDFEIFKPVEKKVSRQKLMLEESKKIILFASHFSNPVKNFPLAEQAINKLKNKPAVLEIKNYTRQEVCDFLNACDVMLLTSHSEGSPQIIKEAMACNCPIVATNVGDIEEVVGDERGCYITTADADDVALKLKEALAFEGSTNGRKRITHLDNKLIAAELYNIYTRVYNSYYKKRS